MSISSLMVNVVDLAELVPGRDTSGGNSPVPTTVTGKTGISCNVQPASASTRAFWNNAQERQEVSHSVYFEGEALGIEVSGATPIKDYRLTWTDPPSGSVFLRIVGYMEATVGRFLVWKADCRQTK
jgi:hypothetical protein